ncbi:MAG: hypothetical protein L3K15_04345 [Thermoplasmata archaeon]|nr:hypothetical protein [Thermoplasmata archaeon]
MPARRGTRSPSTPGSRGAPEPLDVRALTPPAPFPLVEVRNPAHQTRYLVALPEFPDRAGALCSCDDYARRGKGTCKHIEAAFVALRAHPPAPPAPPDPEWVRSVWAEIDRRGFVPREGVSPGPREVRAAGRVLCDAADPYAPRADAPRSNSPARSRTRPPD